MRFNRRIQWFFTVLLLLPGLCFAAKPEQAADSEIQSLYQHFQKQGLSRASDRIAYLTQFFLDRPYSLGALGEGDDGEFDQSPLYRTDKFDCVTFCSTLLGIAHANSLEEFKRTIKKIRYREGYVDYLTRNHFMSVDWNPNNTHNGLVQDVTGSLIGRDGNPIALIADTIIDKPSWYQSKQLNQIKLNAAKNKQEKADKLKQLQQRGASLTKERSVILYIPLTAFFNENGEARPEIFGQIPSPSVIEIVRPNWQVKKAIGTNMHISHLGFAVRDESGLRFRVASSKLNKIIDVPLAEYLKACLDSPTIKGITILKVT